jgi:hypothetical protein
MRLSDRQRKAIIGFAMLCVAGAILVLPTIYVVGLWLSPPRPKPSTADVPTLFAEAVWAHFNGGRASTMRPMNPVNLGHFAGCLALADLTADGQVRNVQTGACAEVMPALLGAAYLSRVHMRDEGVLPGKIRYAFAQVATGAWITRSRSKAELIDSLAARSDFGLQWRGADTAAIGYFGRPLAELTLPQAAMLASFLGTVGSRDLGMASSWVDPWCDPERVARMRRSVLEKMRKNGVIDDATFEAADGSELGLVPDPPPGHNPCPK